MIFGKVLRRIKDREVFAEDVLSRIAGDALHAFVPRRDIAFRVEQQNGVVLHALDEKLELLRTAASCSLFGEKTIGIVLVDRDLDRSSDLALVEGFDDIA